ncbi:MAG: acyl-CoA thioesterase [Scytonematopsis contorta HA4267-MV1]|jgi:1,4-dihydroxy-2-naphthoyl-CoA hydrolase|nr:acyl-CoA thioesterase [Scytonematopsis contorta HA4267-MV1]
MTFTYHRTVRFQDTDAAGVVYFANILAICHEAYEESIASVGINLKEFFTHPPIAFPIIHANVDFFRPISCGDKLVVSLIPYKQGVDKFEIAYEILVDLFVVAKAQTRHVCIDTSTRNKREFPDEISEWLETNRKDREEALRRKSREVM